MSSKIVEPPLRLVLRMFGQVATTAIAAMGNEAMVHPRGIVQLGKKPVPSGNGLDDRASMTSNFPKGGVMLTITSNKHSPGQIHPQTTS
mmetsp:Transcript_43729/g.102108  ORF Transcript_43729/g.102108 Transcript_43729/m.102108 type:complete len:89 (+) Transcript_43729:225-491(+)